MTSIQLAVSELQGLTMLRWTGPDVLVVSGDSSALAPADVQKVLRGAGFDTVFLH
jgi:hypothetical protein